LALVTGAGGGIGRAIVLAFLERGVRVVGLDRRAESLVGWAPEEAGPERRFTPVCCDLREPARIREALGDIERTVGRPDIVVNGAGYGGPFHTADQVSDDEWDDIFHVNVRAPSRIAQVVLPWMRERGHGRIVNIASIQELLGARTSSTYAASKHALVGFTRSIAAEWGQYGIAANAVCPGYVETPMGIQEAQSSEHRVRVLARTPTRSVAEPKDVAGLVVWLALDASPYLNGAAIVIDGGLSADVGV
jgi:3-oxoacyl-[acyl-carrier protein] reductase